MAKEKSVGLLSQRKLDRLAADYNLNDVIDRQKYNAIMGGVVVYGLVINLILCKAVPNIYDYMNPLVFFLLYIGLAFASERRRNTQKQNKNYSFFLHHPLTPQ